MHFLILSEMRNLLVLQLFYSIELWINKCFESVIIYLYYKCSVFYPISQELDKICKD